MAATRNRYAADNSASNLRLMAGGLKDVRLMLSTAAEAGIKLDVGELVERNLSMGVDAGMGEQDWSSIHEIARKKAGLD